MFGPYQNQTNIKNQIEREPQKGFLIKTSHVRQPQSVSKLRGVAYQPAFNIKESLQKRCFTVPVSPLQAWVAKGRKSAKFCKRRGSNSTEPSQVGY